MSDTPDTCLIVECTTFDEAEEKLAHLTDMALTLVLPPNIAGEVPDEFRKAHPKWAIGMLGWEGTLNECLCWTAEQAAIKVSRAWTVLKYDPIFRPPNGVYDRELLGALEALLRHGYDFVVINNPGTKPAAPSLKFFPGDPYYQRDCLIVNASEEAMSTPEYGLAADNSVPGGPYDDPE
jgi:hypothetical protein